MAVFSNLPLMRPGGHRPTEFLLVWHARLSSERRVMMIAESHPVYVVVGTCGDKIQYWAAAVSRRRAAQEVGNVLGPEWKTTVLDWRLTPERLAKLNLTRNSVRKIGFAEAIR